MRSLVRVIDINGDVNILLSTILLVCLVGLDWFRFVYTLTWKKGRLGPKAQ
ncbi:uncharacterized protein METZ01_LOCUS239002, partial [marine metagenome]